MGPSSQVVTSVLPSSLSSKPSFPVPLSTPAIGIMANSDSGLVGRAHVVSMDPEPAWFVLGVAACMAWACRECGDRSKAPVLGTPRGRALVGSQRVWHRTLLSIAPSHPITSYVVWYHTIPRYHTTLVPRQGLYGSDASVAARAWLFRCRRGKGTR